MGLKELIEEAQRIGGFYLYTWDRGSMGWSVVDQTGLKEQAVSDHGMVPSWLWDMIRERKSDEVVVYGPRFIDRKVRKWLRTRYETVPAKASDVLVSGGDEPASKLIYVASRKEADDFKRWAGLEHGLTAPTRLIEAIVEELRKHPECAMQVFSGVFPKWEQKYHVSSNGRILIARADEVTSENKEEFVHNY